MRTRAMGILCALLAFASAITWADPQAPTPASPTTSALSLKQAIQYALENSPTLDSARKARSLAEFQLKDSVAKFLPSLDFISTNGLQNNIPISSTTDLSLVTPNPSAPWYSSLNLSLTENLYDNGVSLTQLGVARRSREVAELNALKARDTLVLNVAAEYYRYSLATVLLGVRKEQQVLLDHQFKNLNSQYLQGFKTRSDFLRLKAQVQRAEINTITAENTIAASDANLRNLLGIGVGSVEGGAIPGPSYAPIEVKRGLNVAKVLPAEPPRIENFYDFKAAKAQEEVNEGAVTLADRNYWPQLSAVAGATFSNQDYIASTGPFAAGNQLSWDALVTVQFNFWDWGIRHRAIAEAEFNRDEQNDAVNANLLNLRSQVATLMGNVSRVARNYKLNQDLLALQEETAKHLETQYRDGKVNYLDLITGLNDLLGAKVDFCTVFFDVLQNEAQYRFFEGTLYDRIMEE